MESLEVTNGTYPEKDQFGSVDRDGWDLKTKQEASSYLHAVKKFEFITGLVSLFWLLHQFVGITQNLQGRSTDAVKEVRGCMEDVKHARENIDFEFHIVYQQPESLAKAPQDKWIETTFRLKIKSSTTNEH